MFPNVRIRSARFGTVHAYWLVHPSQADSIMSMVWSELDELRAAEPAMEWGVDTKGEDSDWHEWKS